MSTLGMQRPSALSQVYSSPLITTKFSFSEWAKVFGDPKKTAALLGRLAYHCHIVEKVKRELEGQEFQYTGVFNTLYKQTKISGRRPLRTSQWRRLIHNRVSKFILSHVANFGPECRLSLSAKSTLRKSPLIKIWSKRNTIVLLVVGVVAVASTYCSKRNPRIEDPKFRTATIDQGPITQVVLATGTLQPVITVNVGTQVSGTVLERRADFNDHVTKGQILLRLDPATLQARVRQAQAQLRSSEAALVLARSTYERNLKLVTAGFISPLTLDQGKREVDAGAASVELARAQVESAQTDLDNSVIRAPIDGVVIRRNIDVGQTVAASFQTPDLYLLAKDLRQMVIQTNVSEADVGLIQVGQLVRFTVDAYPEREFDGKVQQFRLNSASNQGVVTYTIVVDVANTEELLKPGMTAQTRIVVAHQERVTRLPTASLRFRPDDDSIKATAPVSAASTAASAPDSGTKARAEDDGVLNSTRAGRKVYRVYTVGEKQAPKLHDVTIGISNTRFTELISGDLKPGDDVITRSAEPPVKK